MPQEYQDIDALLRGAKASLRKADALSSSWKGEMEGIRLPAPETSFGEDLWSGVTNHPGATLKGFLEGAKDPAIRIGKRLGENALGAAKMMITPAGDAAREIAEPLARNITFNGVKGSLPSRNQAIQLATGIDPSSPYPEMAADALTAVLFGKLGGAGKQEFGRNPRPTGAVEPMYGPSARGVGRLPQNEGPIPVSKYAGPAPERWAPNTSAAPEPSFNPDPPALAPEAPRSLAQVLRPEPTPSPRHAPFAELPEPAAAPAQPSPLASWLAKYGDAAPETPAAAPEMAPRHAVGAGALPEGVDAAPRASFLAHQDDFNGGSIPLYNIEGGPNHGSTVSAATLADMGIAVPETPPFGPQNADEFSNVLKGREKFATQHPDAELAPGAEPELDRLGLEYQRTQAELKRLLGMADADPREVARMKQGARELGSRLRQGAKTAAAPPPETSPTPAAPTSLAEMLQASIDAQDAERAARSAATPPAPRGQHFRLPEANVPDDVYSKIRDSKGIPPSPIARASREVGGGVPDASVSKGDRFSAEFPFGDDDGIVNLNAGVPLPAKTALGLAGGAAAGSYFDEDHARGALIGGGLGAALMLPNAAQKLERLRYFSMLMGPAQAKNLVGNTGVAINTAAERALTHGPSAGGKVLKEFFSPDTVKDFVQTFKQGDVPLDRMDLPASTADRGPLGLPFRIMGAGDRAAKNALARGGVEDGAKRTFTSDPETAMGQSVMQFQRKGGPLARLLMPFVKTAVNATEAGVTPFAKLRRLSELSPAEQRETLTKVGLLTGAGAAGAAYGTTDFAQEHPKLSPWAAVAAGPGALPFAVSQQFSRALSSGKKPAQAAQAAGSALQSQMPMPSEWAFSPASILASLIPTGLRSLNPDTVERDTSGSVFGPMIARIPFLSKTLPPKKKAGRKAPRIE